MIKTKEKCYHFRLTQSQHSWDIDEEMMGQVVFENKEQAYKFFKEKQEEYYTDGFEQKFEWTYSDRKILVVRKGLLEVCLELTTYPFVKETH